MVDGNEALKGLITIIGSGGLVTMIGAFLAFRSEAHKGRRGEPEVTAAGVSGPAITAADVELLANAVSLLASAATQIAAQMKLAYDTEQREQDIEEAAEMRALLNAFRKSAKMPSRSP